MCWNLTLALVLPETLPSGTAVATTANPCGAGYFLCKLGGCVAQSQVCDFNQDCNDGSDEASCGEY